MRLCRDTLNLALVQLVLLDSMHSAENFAPSATMHLQCLRAVISHSAGGACQVELERLRDWHDKKSSLYLTSVAAWKRFREAYNKRQKKHEEVRDNVNKELNSQFNRCAWRPASFLNQ